MSITDKWISKIWHVPCLVMSDSLRPQGPQPARLLCPWGFSRQEYWIGLPCPPPWDLPNPGIEPSTPALQVGSLLTEPPGKPKNTESGWSIPSSGDLPDPGIKPGSPAFQEDSLPTELWGKPTDTEGKPEIRQKLRIFVLLPNSWFWLCIFLPSASI